MNTSIGKRLALLLSGVLLLTGCYAAPAAESVRQGSTPPESVQPTQPPAAETAITTYPVPEENLLVSINMADSPSTGGFWQWDMMLHPYIEAYDPVTRTAYVPCYQSGCRHNDSTCSACFGNLSALAEYRDSLYALVQRDGESAASLVSRPLSGGALRVLASWEPENEGEEYRCALRCISFGKAYLTVTRAAYLPEDGQLTRDEQENRLVSVDLQTGEEATILEHAENYDLCGVWGDCAVFQVQETAEGAPDFADWAAQQPEEASWDEYERLYIRYRILSRDLRTGVETTIVDGSEPFVWSADPHRSWGKYAVYQVGRSVYVYDMETQETKKLFTHEQERKFYNYLLLDGHAIVLCGTENACNAWAVDLADGSVIELDTRGENAMPFSAHYECDGYFAGLLSNSPGNYELCHISKEDFYRSNYDGAFR